MMQKQLGWGRKAVERFAVDKEAQIEALRQIGIDVNLYQELERRAALQAEIRKATLQQELSTDSKYFRYIKPGKQITPKEKELKSKISSMMTLVTEQRQAVETLEERILKCNEEMANDWSDTNKAVLVCLSEDERLEKNGPQLARNCNLTTIAESISLHTLKARIDKDIAILERECKDLDNKIANQKTHVEYIRNYERLGLPRDLRKIDQLQEELRCLKLNVPSSQELPVNENDVEVLKQELDEHTAAMGNYYAKKALKDSVPNGLLMLVKTNRALCKEKSLLSGESERLRSEIQSLKEEILQLPCRRKSAVVRATLFPDFSTGKIFPRTNSSISIDFTVQ